MRNYPGMERVLVPVRERDDNHRHYGDEDENFEGGGDLADHLDTANVDPGEKYDQASGQQVVLPPGHVREVVAEVVREQYCVCAAEQEGGRPVPPSGEESPKVAKGDASPAIETAFDRHGCGKFRGHQRDGDTPEQGNYQQIEKRDSRAGGCDHVLEAERASGGVREHDEDKVKESCFTEGGRVCLVCQWLSGTETWI